MIDLIVLIVSYLMLLVASWNLGQILVWLFFPETLLITCGDQKKYVRLYRWNPSDRQAIDAIDSIKNAKKVPTIRRSK